MPEGTNWEFTEMNLGWRVLPKGSIQASNAKHQDQEEFRNFSNVNGGQGNRGYEQCPPELF